MLRLEGAIAATVTHFARGGGLDEGAVSAHAERLLDEGLSGLVPCGTTGESPTLSPAEHDRVVALTVEAARGRAPVVAGAGSNSTAEAIERTRHAEDAGADAAMLVVPYYNRPSQEGLARHFEAVLAATDRIPLVIYNIPGRSAADLETGTLAALMRDPRLIGVKDATRDLARPSAVRAEARARGRGGDFFQLSGEDATALAFLAQGGHGCISVTANVAPRLCADMHAAWRRGDVAEAQRIDEALQPLHAALFSSPSPGPTKHALSLLGLGLPDVRLPLTPPPPGPQEATREALARAGLLPLAP